MKEKISHKARVKSVYNDKLIVTVLNASACSGCHSKSACGLADIKEKLVEINDYSGSYNPGDEITVYFEEQDAFSALFYGYLLPFILVLATLLIVSQIANEITAGVNSILILIPYYGVLYFLKDKMKKKFNFQIENLS